MLQLTRIRVNLTIDPRFERKEPPGGIMQSLTRRPALSGLALIRSIASIFAAPLLFASVAAIAVQSTPALAADGPQTDDEKAFYAIGAGTARQLKSLLPLSDRELDMYLQGARDTVAGNALALEPESAQPLIKSMVERKQAAALAPAIAAGEAFVAEKAKTPGAKVSESGLVYIETQAGTGATPRASDRVRAHYHGTMIDGTVFDSSVERNQPFDFSLSGVISCWTEGIAMMKVGTKATLICPPKIAYGFQRKGSIPAASTLIFDVELLEVLPGK